MWRSRKHIAEQAREDTLEQSIQGGRMGGSFFASLISLIAIIFSGFSFYESVLRAPQLAIYVPPRIDYTDPDRPDNPFEVFIIPVTIANDGAKTGTVLSINLEVKNIQTNKSKRFFASNIGSWGRSPGQAFAPISLAGKSSVSQAVQFFPRADEPVPRILDLEPGNYHFKLSLSVASAGTDSFFAPQVNPLNFNMKAGQMDYRNFNNNGTLAMWNADYRSASTNPE